MKRSMLVLCPFCKGEQRIETVDNVVNCLHCGELFEIDEYKGKGSVPFWQKDVF